MNMVCFEWSVMNRTVLKGNRYIGEVLLNHLMFADDICVFCPSVRWLQRILDVCQLMQNLMVLVSTATKLFVGRLRLSAKSTVTPLLTLCGQNVKSADHYKYLGIVLDTELSDDKDIQRHLQYQYCAANKQRVSFFQCSKYSRSKRLVAKLSLLLCYLRDGENNLPSTPFKIYTEFNKKCACTKETTARNLCNERLGVLF